MARKIHEDFLPQLPWILSFFVCILFFSPILPTELTPECQRKESAI